MAYEARENGTHAMTCDSPNCHMEMLSPGKDELAEDLALAGWVAVGKDKAGVELYQCHACSRGQHPLAAVIKARLGGTDEVLMEAPCNVTKGDEVHDPDGNVFGHYMEDAVQGDPVQVKVKMPEPERPPSAIELYDDMLEGTDADDDRVGRVSAVAPRDAAAGQDADPDHQRALRQIDEANDLAERHMEEDAAATAPKEPPPVPRSLAAAPGADSSGIVRPAGGRPDTKDPAVQEKLRRAPAAPRGPAINQSALDDTATIFHNIDTSWDPDAD